MRTSCIPQELCSDLHGKELQKRVDVCVHIPDPLCCAVGTNTTL